MSLPDILKIVGFALAALSVCGCGTTQTRTGTEQLLLSDAVDRSIDQMDIGILAGRSVYLDTTYLRAVKGPVFVNADYITSTLRQKLVTSGCRLADDKKTASYVMEARVGALGSDGLEVTYGIPASNMLNTAASLVSGTPALPSVPEISFGKRQASTGVAKVGLFVYHRESGEPVWQSGSAVARSDLRDSWLMGLGPLTRGSIQDGFSLADIPLRMPWSDRGPSDKTDLLTARQFVHPAELEFRLAAEESAAADAVQPASHEQEAK